MVLFDFPSRYNHTMLWEEERDHINSKLLKDIDPIKSIKGAAAAIETGHRHFVNAIEMLERVRFPTDPEDFFKNFRFREWDLIGEKMLLAMRLRLLKGNAFQNLLVSIYAYEHGASICESCGLLEGGWCRK